MTLIPTIELFTTRPEICDKLYMYKMGLHFVLHAILSCVATVLCHHVPPSTVSYRQDGDILLGGLFPVHETGPNGQRCSQLRERETLYRLEAMVFAIDEINGREDILPNVTIGFEIRDTCSDVSATEMATLKFLPSSFTRGGEQSAETNYTDFPIVGVIGTEMSSTTMAAAQLLGLNHIPVVSYFATSDDISDDDQYPYFLRVVPPDKLQVQAMLKIVDTYNWSYISVVHSDDSYGLNAYQEIVRSIENIEVCLAGTFEVGFYFKDRDYDNLVREIEEKPEAKVIILFVHVEQANGFLSALRRSDVVGQYQILGSDGWGMSMGEVEVLNRRIASGSLKTHLFSTPVPEFEEYFFTLNEEYADVNPWFEEYWNASRNCSVIKYGEYCLSSPGFSAGSAVSLVIDAVYTVALGLSEMIETLCNGKRDSCPNADSLNTAVLYQFMEDVSFFGRSGLISFDESGDVNGRYIIENMQLVEGNYELVKVGIWTANNGNQLYMNDSLVTWGPGDLQGYDGIPLSYCSDPCQPGQIYIPRENDCCWNCFNCSDFQITINNQTECYDCSVRDMPDSKRVACVPVEAAYILWDDPLAITLTICSFAGVVFCTVTVYYYVRNKDNILIKASSKELSSIIIVGVYMSYLLVLSLLAKPSKGTCFVNRMLLILSFTVIYAPMLTRVNRIYRIFRSAMKSAHRPGCISPTSQVAIALLTIGIQVMITSICLIVEPPDTVEIVVVPREVALTCNSAPGEIVASFIYNFILIILCSVFAFLARKVPNNYNESRFIALSVYTVLVIWIGFIASYFAIVDSRLKSVVISFTMICNGTITLCFMFISKLYAIYFDKEVLVNSTAYASGGGSATGSERRNENPAPKSGGKLNKLFKGSSVGPVDNEDKSSGVPYTEPCPSHEAIKVKSRILSQENVCTNITGSTSNSVD